MKPESIRLFVKPYCGWCDEALEWFASRGIAHETLDVTRNAAARAEMFALTGQTRAPSVEVDGEVLADFGTDELETWWRENGFEPPV